MSSIDPGGDLAIRWRLMRPFALVGVVCVVTGGLVAAVSDPAGLDKGSWAAAYLVLVAGVAQIGLGAGQAVLPAQPPSRRETTWAFLFWNAANIAVLVGSLAGLTVSTFVGGIALVGALGLFLHGAGRGGNAATGWLALYRALVILLGGSIPVGLALAVMRGG